MVGYVWWRYVVDHNEVVIDVKKNSDIKMFNVGKILGSPS